MLSEDHEDSTRSINPARRQGQPHEPREASQRGGSSPDEQEQGRGGLQDQPLDPLDPGGIGE